MLRYDLTHFNIILILYLNQCFLLQVEAVYSLQQFCYMNDFPKGMSVDLVFTCDKIYFKLLIGLRNVVKSKLFSYIETRIPIPFDKII